ncbi:MAG: tetratricopeptide repeat protein [Polyangia bacterium]
MSRSTLSVRWAAAALFALGLTGCPPSQDVKGGGVTLNLQSLPADPAELVKVADAQFDQGPAGLRNAQAVMEKALQSGEWANSKAGFEGQWRLARAVAEQCGIDEGAACQAGLAGALAAAKKAVELDGTRVEGHYYLAQLYGFAAHQQRGGDIKPLLMQLQSEGDAAIKAGERFDSGGPARMLGAIYAKAPAPPVAIGDTEKGVQYLKRAVEIAPEHPQNHILLAEAYIADERYQDAESELKQAKTLLADPRWEKYRETWKAQLSTVERKLRAKQS